jgi:hypothetical protein
MNEDFPHPLSRGVSGDLVSLPFLFFCFPLFFSIGDVQLRPIQGMGPLHPVFHLSLRGSLFRRSINAKGVMGRP